MSIEPMTLNRRAADRGEPTNSDILRRIEELEAKLDTFTVRHSTEHHDLDGMLAALQSGALLREHRLTSVEAKSIEIADLHDFKVQLQTLGRLTQFIVGSSAIAAIAAIASLVLTLSHLGVGT